MDWYQPSAIVLQCGGDSLSGDKLGCFNLSMRGHANCVNYVKSFHVPTMVVGGGGYTMRNVARTWSFETGLMNEVVLDAELPFNDYYEYYGPDYKLDVRPSNMYNANSPEYLDRIMTQIFSNLENTKHAPSVQIQDVPADLVDFDDDPEEDAKGNIDTRGGSQKARDELVVPDNEFYDKEEDAHKSKDSTSYKDKPSSTSSKTTSTTTIENAASKFTDSSILPKDYYAKATSEMMDELKKDEENEKETEEKDNGQKEQQDGKMDIDGDTNQTATNVDSAATTAPTTAPSTSGSH
ncbi:unnamed protein product [Ambrosiozyma monospora]|uniref:Unnamed protein product n=1 Tax=Ambrosiozyma monospora TaxID=43982 RepID=A0A9W7DJW5_AMBMO|nr:unnamed protein product [Ambrosiozyma monospora]